MGIFSRKPLQIMSQVQLQIVIPTLKGENYHEWARLMKAFLQQQGVWFIAIGTQTRPAIAGAQPTVEEQRARFEWDSADSRATGMIMGKLTADIAAKVDVPARGTSNQKWTYLLAEYGEVRPPQVFHLFKQYSTFRFDPSKPLIPQLNHLETLNSRLVAQQCNIPDLIRGMMLLTQLPPAWQETIAPPALQGGLAGVTFDVVVDGMRVYSDTQQTKRLGTAKGVPAQVHKISVIKRQPKSQSFQDQRAPIAAALARKRRAREECVAKVEGKKPVAHPVHFASTASLEAPLVNTIMKSDQLVLPSARKSGNSLRLLWPRPLRLLQSSDEPCCTVWASQT
jgi:hypothetical protein